VARVVEGWAAAGCAVVAVGAAVVAGRTVVVGAPADDGVYSTGVVEVTVAIPPLPPPEKLA
jgi:hypothetical protein